MKVGGVSVTKRENDCLVIPRDGEPLVFWAEGIEWDEFNKLCPEPTPPGKLTKDGWVPDPEDANFKTIMEGHNKKRVAYLVVKSLEPSKIEWDSVDLQNPKTWVNYEKDMKAAGMTQAEVNYVVKFAFEANYLDEDKLNKARDSFLRGQGQVKNTTSGQNTEPMTTPSGEPVSA